MPRKKTNPIAIPLQIVLGLILMALLGLFSGLLTGDTKFVTWLNAQPWYSSWNATWAIIVTVAAMIAVAIWQYDSSRGEEPLSKEDLEAALRKTLEAGYDSARDEGRIPQQDWKAKEEEIARLTEELGKLQQQLAARSSEPAEAELSKLLKSGDLDAAFRLKSSQIERRRQESEKLPRDLYELGVLCELRFDWQGALDSFRKAWELGRDPDHGFKYAYFAQKLNHFDEAITVYEALLAVYIEPRDVATTLNNLAVLYSDTQRMKEAEQAYDEALAIYRKLAEANPDAYLPYVATTLNNLAFHLHSTGRFQEAETNASEAERILHPLWQAYPELHGNQMASTLDTRARVAEAGQKTAEACALARRALAAAYDPVIQESIQQLIDRLCPASTGRWPGHSPKESP